MKKHVNLVDLIKSFPTNILLQNLASIQKRTSPIKFAHLAEKSENGSISNLSTKLETRGPIVLRNEAVVVVVEEPPRLVGVRDGVVCPLVERFDIEPFFDFSAK